MATPNIPLWEVFIRSRNGLAHKHVGSLHATDATLALQAARAMIASGFDMQLPPLRRVFVYLPFEHAEDRAAQAESLRLFEALGLGGYADYARRHAVIVERFGRFPHRNAILGRTSTPEEVEFLKQPGSGF